MSKVTKSLITVLSWEERFIKGFEQDLSQYAFDRIFLLRYEGREKLKENNLKAVQKLIKRGKMRLVLITLPNDRTKRWKLLEENFLKNNDIGKKIILDITTMRRETIWSLLSFLNHRKKSITYVYYQPQDYNEEWLSREPDVPQLLFKHSGVTRFKKKLPYLL